MWRLACQCVFVFFLLCCPALAQPNYFWNATTGSYTDATRWSFGVTTPAGPPAAGDRALFLSGSSFTVSGNGSPAQVVVQVSDATFTGVIAPQGGVTGFPSLITGFEVGVSGFGKATFTGNGAALNSAVPVAVGTSNTGQLVFSAGATGQSQAVTGSAGLRLGANFTGNGTLTLTGQGSSFTCNGSFDMAGNGIAEVHVEDEAHLDTNGSLALGQAGLNMAVGASSQATLNISGNATVHNELQTNLGLSGKGTLNITSGMFTTTDGGTANPAISIARFSNSEGYLNVSGTGQVITQGEIIVGGGGQGQMFVTENGLVESFVTVGAPAIVGFGSTADGLATIDGPDARWNVTDALVVGQQGVGLVELLNGATLFVEDTIGGGDPYLLIGDASGSSGTMRVNNESSFLDASFIPTTIGTAIGSFGRLEITELGEAFLQFTKVGNEGDGEVFVENGVLTTGTAEVGSLDLGSGLVTLAPGALWEVLGQLVIGREGQGQVLIEDGATMTVDSDVFIGDFDGSFGSLTLDGQNAIFNGNFPSVTLGSDGTGELHLQNQAVWNVAGDVLVGVHFGEGDAYIDSDSTWAITGSLYVGGSATAAGNGSGQIEVTGTVQADSGTKVWDFGSVNLVSAGTLLTPLVEVHGRILGSGTVDSASSIIDGFLFPGDSPVSGSTGRLNFTGNYQQTDSAQVNIDLQGIVPETEFDVIHIGGDALLDGNLTLDLLGSFSLSAGQTFKIIDITGACTGMFNGLGQNALVGNFNGTDLFISYNGGDGNDVVLFTTADPGAPQLVAARPYHNAFPGLDGQAKVDTSVSMILRGMAPQLAMLGNIISSSQGINGVVLDFNQLNALGDISLEFKVSPVNVFVDPISTWGDAPPPMSIDLLPNAGEAGSDRVLIKWNDGSIANQYLCIQVVYGINTIAELYLGHLKGEMTGGNGTVFSVSYAADLQPIRIAVGTAPGASGRPDVDKNNQVQLADIVAMRSNAAAQLVQLIVPALP